VDTIAGRGTMGFDPPFLSVQVKSTDAPIDVSVLRELQGTMRNYNADRGLLVSWGGFKTSVLREAPRQFFEIRFWDANQMVKAIVDNSYTTMIVSSDLAYGRVKSPGVVERYTPTLPRINGPSICSRLAHMCRSIGF